MNPLLDPTGFVPGDLAAALIASLAAAFSYLRIARTAHDFPRWMISLGWTLIAVRLWHALAVHGDAPVAPISLIALSMIGGGTVLLQIKKGMR